MTNLKLYVLGPPRVELNNEPVELSRRKALALLVYLAVTGQPHSRDMLATMFYPDHSQSRARACLRRDLAILNTSLAGDWLEADRDTAALKAGYWLDVSQFRVRLADCREQEPGPDCVALLSEAVDLYKFWRLTSRATWNPGLNCCTTWGIKNCCLLWIALRNYWPARRWLARFCRLPPRSNC